MMKKRDLPQVLKSALRGYRKHDVSIMKLGETHSRRSSHWDGGSRRIDTPFILKAGELLPMPWPKGSEPGNFPMFKPGEAFDCPENMVIVSTGTSLGKTALAYFYMSEETAAKLNVEVGN